MPFTTPLQVESLPGRWWRLTAKLVYVGKKESFTVPDGFVTDFASTPQWFEGVVPRDGTYIKAAVLHDWLYETKPVSRKDADGIFRRVMREEGTGVLTRWTMYISVRIFGRSRWRDE